MAPFAHGGAVAQAIYRLKYRGRREVARSLAPLLSTAASGMLAGVDAIAPIPLHPARRRSRGYDQALLLARELSRLSRRPLRPRLLSRVRETQQQVGLDREGRGRNLDGAFEASPAARGLRIALVDDVVTTGATARAAAGALALVGAKGVVVLALARAGT